MSVLSSFYLKYSCGSYTFSPRYALYGTTMFLCCMKFQNLSFQLERHFQLPTPPSGGHGAAILLVWTLAFLAECLALLSYRNDNWFFKMKTLRQQVDSGFYIARFVFATCVLSLGLKHPGIPSVRDYIRYQDEEVSEVDDLKVVFPTYHLLA